MSERREYAVFAACIGVAALHVLDDAFIGKQPGTSAGDHLLAAVVILAVFGAALVVYPRVRPGARAAIALALGVLITTAGAMHLVHAVIDEAELSDFTGILAAAAGVVLMALGAVLVGFFVLFPIGIAIYVTHTPREPIDGTFAVSHKDVSFETSDGLTIRGWYSPSRNGAAIVLVHGSGGNRMGPRKQAALLARHGYGVLLYDSRGRGESDGDPQGFDWTWQPDVDAAIDYLKSRPDVRDGRIGAVGLSAGAETVVETAARRPDLRAVVAEGAGFRAYGDGLDVPGWDKWVMLPNTVVMLAAAQVLSGWPEVRSVGDFVGDGAPGRVLLIAAGHGLGAEDKLNPIWAERAKARV